jgi:Ser-tRNA(Ala) deacylase AlaX
MTQLIYLKNQYLYECTGRVLSIETTEKGLAIILDRTVFYPQGGGQPGDSGIIKNENGTYAINNTLFGENGEVWHIVNNSQGKIVDGEEVVITINKENRIRNSILHSAGHLIDMAVSNAGLNWKPRKGYHFADGCYVDYEADSDAIITDDITAKIQT